MNAGERFVAFKVEMEDYLSQVFEGRDVNLITEQYFSVWGKETEKCKKLAAQISCVFVAIKDRGSSSQRMIFKLGAFPGKNKIFEGRLCMTFKPVKYYPEKGIVMKIPASMNDQDKATLQMIQVTYGYVLTKQGGHSHEYSFKEWADLICDVYDIKDKRNRYVIEFLINLDSELKIH